MYSKVIFLTQFTHMIRHSGPWVVKALTSAEHFMQLAHFCICLVGRLPKNLWICIYFLILDSCESNVTEVTYSGVSIRVGESADDDLALRALSWAHHWIQEFFKGFFIIARCHAVPVKKYLTRLQIFSCSWAHFNTNHCTNTKIKQNVIQFSLDYLHLSQYRAGQHHCKMSET